MITDIFSDKFISSFLKFYKTKTYRCYTIKKCCTSRVTFVPKHGKMHILA